MHISEDEQDLKCDLEAYPGPSMKMKGSEFSKIGLIHMDIETLTLIYVATAVYSHIDQGPLLDLPNSPEVSRQY